MRVYQCIHKYGPHIPQFERRHGIDNRSRISFRELRRLIVEDGYAAAYVLAPALEDPDGDVFFTIWNYERLQRAWARERGLPTDDLHAIRLAQIEEFRPDVVYNMSAFYDREFAARARARGVARKYVCWNAIIEDRPTTIPGYDCHFSLHRPFVEEWVRNGVRAAELQPGIPARWVEGSRGGDRDVDVFFYGQYASGVFSRRNRIADALLRFGEASEYKADVSLQIAVERRTIFGIPGTSRFRLRVTTFPPRWVRKAASAPLYGAELYARIAQSKLVVNAYGDHNQHFKSNMRLFEAIGNGALLLSERGNYPDGFQEGRDYLGYGTTEELMQVMRDVLGDWPRYRDVARAAQGRIARLYSKERQWNEFTQHVALL